MTTRTLKPLLLTMVIALVLVTICPVQAEQQAWPNRFVNTISAPVSEQNNADVALSETVPGEIYSLWTEFTPAGFGASNVGLGISPDGGLTWTSVILAVPVFPFEWNPAIAAAPPAVGPTGGFLRVSAGYSGVPWLATNGIMMDFSPGGGAVFAAPIALATNIVATNWFDFPNVEVDKYASNPAPAYGTGHMAWVEYLDGTGGDADGNGNPFDDAAPDGFVIWYSYTHLLASPPPIYPAFAGPIAVFGAPSATPNQMAAQRPDLAVVAAVGNAAVPPGGVYLAWTDGATAFVDASIAPGAGFGALGGAPVPLPMTPIPAVIAPGINAASTVTLGVDNSGGPCTGQVYLAYADVSSGDADIYLVSSPTGLAGSWTAPVRVNQDPIGNGLDQWAPEIYVDPASGAITITYYSRRNDPANVMVETWSATSVDCGLTWTECLFSDAGPVPPVSTIPLPPAAQYVGDYLGADFSMLNGSGHVWNDGRNGSDQDIFFENTCLVDSDADGIPDLIDNCPSVPNPGQANSDGDNFGDVCDNCPTVTNPAQTNSDGDSFGDLCDNCPTVTNPTQTNSDSDSLGDLCDNCPTVVNPSQTNSDGDSVGDLCDNCPTVTNPTQTNSDSDSLGDLCDNCPTVTNPAQTNSDSDSLGDLCDNCPTVTNPSQSDGDSDAVGDACDNCPTVTNTTQTNSDGDSFGDLCDNCPTVTNPTQTNSDSDSFGDLCDNCPTVTNPTQTNSDGDSFGDLCDNCPTVTNPTQTNSDGDSFGDLCDNCPTVTNPTQSDGDSDAVGDACDNCLTDYNPLQEDTDMDGVGDSCDNCIYAYNPLQEDTDADGIGDSCETVCDCTPGDADGNTIINISDAVYLIAYIFGGGPAPTPYNACSGDADCNCIVNISDAVYLIAYIFGGGPAPCDCLTWLGTCGPPLH